MSADLITAFLSMIDRAYRKKETREKEGTRVS
jgi:hypothetical protein